MDGKEMLFKSYVEGKAKASQKPYRILELHDPTTLENVKIFLPEGSAVSVEGFKFKDKVRAFFAPVMQYGKLELMLSGIQKI